LNIKDFYLKVLFKLDQTSKLIIASFNSDHKSRKSHSHKYSKLESTDSLNQQLIQMEDLPNGNFCSSLI